MCVRTCHGMDESKVVLRMLDNTVDLYFYRFDP